MGAHPYWYVVPYRPDLQGVLDELRAREFAAGRYHPVISFMKFSEPAFSKQNPGAQHASIDEAMEAADADGTRSILDIGAIGDHPDYGVAAPLSDERLIELFGTTRPARADVEKNHAFFEGIDRGHCVYVVLYENGKPSEVFFAGYSYD